MKIKQMIKWNWQNSYMGLIVLYGVFILLYLFAFAVNVSAGGETVNVNGMSTGSVVMMLVYGIVLFSQSLRFGLGNGVSRRTVFLSFLAFFWHLFGVHDGGGCAAAASGFAVHG